MWTPATVVWPPMLQGNEMTGYFSNYGPEQQAMVERWLGRMRKRLAGARDASDIGRVLARERHLETLNQPLPMSAQRLAKLEAEVDRRPGRGPVPAGGRLWRDRQQGDPLRPALHDPGGAAGGQAPGRRPALRPRVLAQSPALPAGPDGGRLVSSKERMAATFLAGPRRHPDHDHPSEEDHGWIDSAPHWR